MIIDLVIFDCDGVLVDSEVISCRVHAEILTRYGYPITAGDVLVRFLGVSDREARAIVEADMGRGLPGNFEAQVKQAIAQSYVGELCAIPGVGDAIDRLRVPVCVASSGTPEKIRHGLTIAGLHDRFASNIFSASQVAHGKPAPDLFLFAAAQMGVSPDRCLVIEDSVPGVTGAVAAGMMVLGFTGGSHCLAGHADLLRAAGAATIFDDMSQLTDIIGGLIARPVAASAP